MFQVVIWLQLKEIYYQINNHIPHRNHTEILELYDGRECTEISVETGGFCNGECVIPSTPNPSRFSVCPDRVDNIFSSRLQNKKIKRKKGKSTHRKKKKVTEGEGRLGGTSTLHTFTTSGPLRYPWTCSLKTRGFRWGKELRRKASFSGVDTCVPWPSCQLLQGKPSLWRRPIATFCARTAPTMSSCAAADHPTRATLAIRLA